MSSRRIRRPADRFAVVVAACGLWLCLFDVHAPAQFEGRRPDGSPPPRVPGFGVQPPTRVPGFGVDSSTPPEPPSWPKPPEVLERLWPNAPEWVAMLAEIVSGGQPLAGKGWYRTGVSGTRFDWPAVRARLDRDHDGRITRQECPVSDADFARLDRVRDKVLTRDDFIFPANELAMARSKIVLSFADRDHDGRVDREEFAPMIFHAERDQFTRHMYFSNSIDDVTATFRRSEAEGIPFLALMDLQEAIDRNAERKLLDVPPDPDAGLDRAPVPTLLHALFRRELGSFRAGPALDAPAPDFTLPALDGRVTVSLSGTLARDKRPLVLVFGNGTSAPFRNEAGNLAKLALRYRDRASFLMVYGRESNPSDGWVSSANTRVGLSVRQPVDDRARAETAGRLMAGLKPEMPVVVDTTDDAVSELYGGMPGRLYVIDARGKIAYKGGRGPFGFKPAELEQSLLWLLQSETQAP